MFFVNAKHMSDFASLCKQKEEQCPVCQKMFAPAVEHAWKVDRDLVCSYTCQRKGEKDPSMMKKTKSGKKIAVRVVETGETFESIRKCAKALNISNTMVHYCVRDGRTVKGLHIERVNKNEGESYV